MKLKTDIPAYILLLAGTVFFIVLSIVSEGTWGGADSIVHFRIARYAFKYPHLFLDLWGKPLFTILSSPFAQFGYNGIKLFNVAVAITTSALAWRILKKQSIEPSYAVIPFILFAPEYFILIPSAMTELLFGLIIVLAIYLFFRENYIASSVVISFLPFARNEGFIIIPLFILAYILRKKYKAIPFVLSAFVFFSLLGWHHFGKLFWIIRNNPYTGDHSIYGHGELLHFVNHLPLILGVPLLIASFTGFFALYRNFTQVKKLTDDRFLFLFLVAGSAIIYFTAHSVVWWKGMGNSLGLTRVIAGIIPLIAMMAVYPFSLIPGKKWIKIAASMAFSALIIWVTLSKYQVPFKLDDTDKLIKQTCDKIKTDKLDNRLIYYYNPVVCHFLEIDPFDTSKAREQLPNHEKPEDGIPQGSIILWDAHFGPNEGHMPIERLKNNNAFREVYHLKPEHEFTVLNGYQYEIYVFERL